jgi:hypothetical protein
MGAKKRVEGLDKIGVTPWSETVRFRGAAPGEPGGLNDGLSGSRIPDTATENLPWSSDVQRVLRNGNAGAIVSRPHQWPESLSGTGRRDEGYGYIPEAEALQDLGSVLCPGEDAVELVLLGDDLGGQGYG